MPAVAKPNINILSIDVTREQVEALGEKIGQRWVEESTDPASILNATHIEQINRPYINSIINVPIFKDGRSIGDHWAQALGKAIGFDASGSHNHIAWNPTDQKFTITYPKEAPQEVTGNLRKLPATFEIIQRYNNWNSGKGCMDLGQTTIELPIANNLSIGHYLKVALVNKEAGAATGHAADEARRTAEENVNTMLFGDIPSEKQQVAR